MYKYHSNIAVNVAQHVLKLYWLDRGQLYHSPPVNIELSRYDFACVGLHIDVTHPHIDVTQVNNNLSEVRMVCKLTLTQ